jgi:hypothetical protein
MKVCIVGKGRGWQDAPNEKDVPVWGITQLILKRDCSLVIDMNVYDDGRWGEKEKVEAMQAKELCKINNIPYVDLSTYPYETISDCFKTDYFSNTVDFALAMALYSGFDEIDLYGITMEEGSEYSYQKPGCDFWCGVAKGMGVNIRVFGQYSTLMRTRDRKVYGFDIKQQTKEERGVVFV